MAIPETKTVLTQNWEDVSGAAATVAGVNWLNDGISPVALAFKATGPLNSDPYVTLQRGEAYYDKNGSAKIWGMKLTDQPGAIVSFAD